jgi:hypothetical protein
MSMTPAEFCESLAHKYPDIAKILTEHFSDNDELLPHVFLADVTRYVLANGPCRKPIVKYLDESFAAYGKEVEDLVAVSFVEYLVNSEELDVATNGVDAPQIRAEWFRQRAM